VSLSNREYKNMEALLIIIGTFYCFNNINAQYKFTTSELNIEEKYILDEYRENHEDVTYNNELMVAAKNEALRLAQQGRLSPPIMNLFGSKNYHGYSQFITDINPNGKN
jgi:hypothetical protein